MRFWDSSAVVPLLLREPGSRAAGEALREDPRLVVWWATPVECESAIARREREGTLSRALAARAVARLRALEAAWEEVAPGAALRSKARDLLRLHPLRAADALQLAAAMAAAEEDPASLPFVTLDDRLGDAARREGFAVFEP